MPGFAGTVGTWTDLDGNLQDNCPTVTGGAVVDGWVQMDPGNEYAMMQAVTWQPISVSVQANDPFWYSYNVCPILLCYPIFEVLSLLQNTSRKTVDPSCSFQSCELHFGL